jgi:hypothetical protein
MQDGTFIDRVGSDTPQKEQILESLARINLLLALSLAPSLGDSKAKDLVATARNWFHVARKEILRIEKQRGKTKHTKVVIYDREMNKMIRQLSKRSAPQKTEPEK